MKKDEKQNHGPPRYINVVAGLDHRGVRIHPSSTRDGAWLLIELERTFEGNLNHNAVGVFERGNNLVLRAELHGMSHKKAVRVV